VTRSVAETFEATRELVRPVVEKQRLYRETAILQDVVDRGETGADRQRGVYEDTGELATVVQASPSGPNREPRQPDYQTSPQ